jgi:superfamily II DNA or RNA helicase
MSEHLSQTHFDDIDFHRNCFALIPPQGEQHQTFLIIQAGKEQKIRLFCSCCKKGYAKCTHAQKLQFLYDLYIKGCGNLPPTTFFEKSLIWTIFEQIARAQANSVTNLKTTYDTVVTVTDLQNKELVRYRSSSADCSRFLGRISLAPLSRYTLMNRAVEFVQSDQERMMLAAGHKTQRQMTEDSLWYRLSYHLHRETSGASVNYIASVDLITGQFVLNIQCDPDISLRINVPAPAVSGVINLLQKESPDCISGEVMKGESELYFRIVSRDELVHIVPVVKVDGSGICDIDKKFVYDSVIFLPAFKRFLKMSYPSLKLLATGKHTPFQIDKVEFSSFLESNVNVFSLDDQTNGHLEAVITDLFGNSGGSGYGRILEPIMITEFDRIELNPITLEAENCTLAVSYCSGVISVPLAELLAVKKRRERFLCLPDCIVDLGSEKILSALVNAKGARDGNITLSRAALLQFRGSSLTTKIQGDEKLVSRINQMLQFKPVKDFEPLEQFDGILREYQKMAVQWLLFLYDNNFGGLLCDEMGLGKTIQVIAFLLSLKEQRDNKGSFLIVCPTSVISHWERLIRKFAPSLAVQSYYSPNRKDVLNSHYDILLSSYGIMRNDVDILKTIFFDVIIFDEVQQLKNSDSIGSKAALTLNAQVKIGVTGTPIENSLEDLKVLFDLVLPGLFHKDYHDDEIFLVSIQEGNSSEKMQIRKLITPFILRRLKATVLTELPPKIEDIRTCQMGEQQSYLYKLAVEERGGPLIQALKNNTEPVPYMHIFSLLSFLKQVCNHPALAAGKLEDYESFESTKWDLFCELLDESIGSGEKVVIFTQFLGMIEIFRLYLEKKGIGHVILTGATRNRDKIIKQFSDDDNCKVFVGSLKAGGVGIDLVAASVLIHYDRWWNAAREDQATDRVHRFGQKRVVQILKLVTEGTVEERIGAIIDRKRMLSAEILVEDAPESIKSFSRDELLELLS